MGTLSDVVDQAVRDSNRQIERYIRDYIKTHRTCRLDIQLNDYGTRYESVDRSPFFIRAGGADDKYEMRIVRDVQIVQKLPESFRPALPD